MFDRKKYAKDFIKYCKDKIEQLEFEFINKEGKVRKEIEELESWESTLKRAKYFYNSIKKK